MLRLLTNNEIYNNYLLLNENITKSDLALPTLVNFAIQKNLKTLLDFCEDIEKTKQKICQQNGTYIPEERAYKIDDDKILFTQQQLDELMVIKQEISIFPIHLEDLKDVTMTPKQMQSLLFMIVEE